MSIKKLKIITLLILGIAIAPPLFKTIVYSSYPGDLTQAKNLLTTLINEHESDNEMDINELYKVHNNLNTALMTTLYYISQEKDENAKQSLKKLYDESIAAAGNWGKKLGYWSMFADSGTQDHYGNNMTYSTTGNHFVVNNIKLNTEKAQKDIMEFSGSYHSPAMAKLVFSTIRKALANQVKFEDILAVLTDEDLENYTKGPDNDVDSVEENVNIIRQLKTIRENM